MELDEEAGTRPLSTPGKPTPTMIEAHEVCHLPFRSWCAFCVRGRGQSSSHLDVDKSDEQVPKISVDYGASEAVDSPANELPILVLVGPMVQECVVAPSPAQRGGAPPWCVEFTPRPTGHPAQEAGLDIGSGTIGTRGVHRGERDVRGRSDPRSGSNGRARDVQW